MNLFTKWFNKTPSKTPSEIFITELIDKSQREYDRHTISSAVRENTSRDATLLVLMANPDKSIEELSDEISMAQKKAYKNLMTPRDLNRNNVSANFYKKLKEIHELNDKEHNSIVKILDDTLVEGSYSYFEVAERLYRAYAQRCSILSQEYIINTHM